MSNRVDRTPTTISEATRKKLEKLKFRAKKDSPAEAKTADPSNKENTRPGPNNAETAEDGTNQPTSTPVNDASSNTKTNELLDSIFDDDAHTSPNDRVMWAAAMQDDRDMYTSVRDVVRRRKGRKRARSSSPTSSPISKANSPAINIKQLAQALRSPHPDPTLELWDRYTRRGFIGDGSPQDRCGNGLADFLVSSSPRPPNDGNGMTPQKESALRRAVASNRLHFNKRRKIETEDDSPTYMTTGGGQSKYSLVTSLLNSVTSSMQDIPQNQDQSPLHMREGTRQSHPRPPAESPSPAKRTRAALVPPPQPIQFNSNQTPPAPALPLPAPAVSDYGDDDFDDDILMAIDAQVSSTAVSTNAAPPVTPGTTNQAPRRSPRKSPREQVNPLAQDQTILDDTSDYGLDDIDDDVFVLAEQAVVRDPVPAVTIDLVSQEKPAVEEEDLLDDDLGDDDDWNAVELAATQAVASQAAHQHIPKPSNVSESIPVCHHDRLEPGSHWTHAKD